MWLLIKASNLRKISLKGLEADLDKSFVTLDVLDQDLSQNFENINFIINNFLEMEIQHKMCCIFQIKVTGNAIDRG